MTEELFFITSMPPSRPADYYIGYQDGCVFLDFNNYDSERICLKRISFDGYGCCELDDKATPLDIVDSRNLKDIFENNLDQQDTLFKLVKKAIALNIQGLWADALQEYNLS